MKLTVHKWKVGAVWTWGSNEELCTICTNAYDSCCPKCTQPEKCYPVWGKCHHCFHNHCMNKWLDSQTKQQCPICRQPWEE